jgi:hypothetical protein
MRMVRTKGGRIEYEAELDNYQTCEMITYFIPTEKEDKKKK